MRISQQTAAGLLISFNVSCLIGANAIREDKAAAESVSVDATSDLTSFLFGDTPADADAESKKEDTTTDSKSKDDDTKEDAKADEAEATTKSTVKFEELGEEIDDWEGYPWMDSESDEEQQPGCPVQAALDARAAALAEELAEEEACAIANVDAEMDHKDQVISNALYDLNNDEIIELENIQLEILNTEDEIKEQASLANADFEQEIEELEVQRIEYQEEEADLIASLIAQEQHRLICEDTKAAYVDSIDQLTATNDQQNYLTRRMADSLAEIDPNMDNGDEGKAFIKMMFRLRNITPSKPEKHIKPLTPMECVEDVAGKVIQIENLQEDIDNTKSFNKFFADVYCSAYTNSLLTYKDGLSQIFPGGLDGLIENELIRIAGNDKAVDIDQLEINSTLQYMTAVYTGKIDRDDSTLIKKVEPINDAIVLCANHVDQQIQNANQTRDDYLDDLNFLRYLKKM